MKLLNVSNHFTLRINRSFLASKNITLVSTGPKLKQQVEIFIHAKSMDSTDFWTCLIRVVSVALLALIMLCITRYYKASADLETPEEQDEILAPADLAAEGEQQPSDEEDSDEESSEADSYLGEEQDKLNNKSKQDKDGPQEQTASISEEFVAL